MHQPLKPGSSFCEPRRRTVKERWRASVLRSRRYEARDTALPKRKGRLRSMKPRTGRSSQQIQKYEPGSTPIGSSRLYELAKVLDVPVSYFFDEMPSNALSGRPMSGRGRDDFGQADTPVQQE